MDKKEVIQQLDETILKMSVAIDMLKNLKLRTTALSAEEIMQELLMILTVKMDVKYQEKPSILI